MLHLCVGWICGDKGRPGLRHGLRSVSAKVYDYVGHCGEQVTFSGSEAVCMVRGRAYCMDKTNNIVKEAD